MVDFSARESELRELIDRPVDPPERGARRPRTLAARAWQRLDRARAARQRVVDHALVGRLSEIVEAIDRSQQVEARHTQRIAELGEWLAQTSARSDEVAGRVDAFIPENASSLRRIERLVAADAPLHGSESFVLEIFDAGLGGEVVGFREGEHDSGEALYLGFEEMFRGREESVLARQRAYLPLLEGHTPVLDVGCGRGELLELLRDAGVRARGVDLDPAMVKRCRAKGLQDVEVGEAVAYLQHLDDATLGAVFAAQVIEHMPYADLISFLRAALAKLIPGGIAILETVNPHSPQARKHFWIDPTHQHPLFPEVVLALCRLTGFASGYIWYPQGCGEPDRDRLEQLDYAVVARRRTTSAAS